MPKCRSLKHLSSLSILLLLATSLAWAANLQVQLDRNRLTVQDTLTLRLIADGTTSGEPDFTPLTQDFDILGRGQSKMTSIVNGAMSHTRQWTLELAPKRTGALSIPSLSLGNARSQSLTVEVTESNGGGAEDGSRPIFLEADAETKAPYVQQAFEYRVRAYFQDEPLRATLSDPLADGATVERIGEDRGYEEFVDGQRYLAIERRYRVIPNRSGPLAIQGPRLEAVVPDTRAGRQHDPFADLDQAFGGTLFQGFPQMQGLGNPGRRLVDRAGDLEIQVRAQPDGSGTPWLPATSVQIADEWTPSQPTFRVGEPLTRTLTVTAQGVTAAQLPTLDLGTLDGVQVYPDQPQSEDLSGESVPTAIKSFKIALVPTRAGPLTLPEIRLHWWDTVADEPRVAVVPARTLEVAAAPSGGAGPSPVIEATTGSEPTGSAESSPDATRQPRSPAHPGIGTTGFWPWLTLLLGLAWLGTLVWWRRERRSRLTVTNPIQEAQDRRAASLNAARRQVEKTCLAGDARAARAALLDWAHARWPDHAPQGLSELANRLGGEEIGDLLHVIDRAIYAPPGEVWDGAAAWQTLAPWLGGATRDAPARADDPLPELYPRT
ncbi:BatD family protein [Thiocystis violascens]|uniref:DUF7939 domain-containing protein n=1 Tax=Thiocystis violascens (strain ATCC 17096 / DSM 198 / 6111) TaxID=765911 RepID=I3Y7E3_THIV6|nr:BatD family protein [Thiocystis violascens]AFL72911.1 hypothetical protein Thivi_0873 [Thiocystis violascens DSM 198]